MNSFNLTTEPWLPCERTDETQVVLSLRQVLAQAHELRALALAQPAISAAVYRHLLAFVHRIVDGPRNERAWGTLVQAGRFDPDAIGAYLDSVQDRLDLFHPTHPFGQVRGLTAKFAPDPIDRLEFTRSSWGGARELFQHRPEIDPLTFEPARAARALLGHHAFATGGLVRKPGEPTSATAGPNLGTAVVLVLGRTLFETLVANLLIYNPADGLPQGVPAEDDDAPAWEQPPLPLELADKKKEAARRPRGYLDMLTWQSRRIEFVTKDDGRVTGFVRAVGQGMDCEAVYDPMVPYRDDKKRGVIPISMRKGRAFWRDSAALFTRVGEKGRVPAAIAQVLGSDVEFEGANGPLGMHRLGIAVFGVLANKSRIDASRTETIWASPEAFDANEDSVKAAVNQAEDAVRALRGAIRTYASHVLSPGDRDAHKDDVSNLANSFGADAIAWSELGEHYAKFLIELGHDRKQASLEMLTACIATAKQGLRRVLAEADQSGHKLHAAARAGVTLSMGLKDLENAKKELELHTKKDAA